MDNRIGWLKKWAPLPGRGIWLQFAPLALMFVVLWMTARSEFSLAVGTVRFWEYVVLAWVSAAATYLVGLVVCLRYLRSSWAAAVFAWFYLLIFGVNTATLYHAGTMLLPYYIQILDWTTWMMYLTKWVWILIGVFAAMCAFATWLIRSNTTALKEFPIRSLVLLLIVLWAGPAARDKGWLHRHSQPVAVNPAPAPAPTSTPAPAPVALVASTAGNGAFRVDQVAILRMVAENPLVIFGRAMIHRDTPLRMHPLGELQAASVTLKTWNLPLGPRQYPPLGLKPFKHIIAFVTESLSQDFLAPYNTNLPPELTPFYASPMVTQAMFVNYQTVTVPTQPGITVMYNSHPNASALMAGNSELSVVKLLNAQGYETYFIKSDQEHFANDKLLFSKIGFKHVIGIETWEKDPQNRPFLDDRGFMDRKLYEIAVKLLEENRDKKIYIHVCSKDTHSPVPRERFGSLQYPSPPPILEKLSADPRARAVMAGVFRHDYDLGETFRQMQERKLFNDDTLVVLTADHCYPAGEVLQQIPGYPAGAYVRIPLAFLSGQTLPQADLRQLHSQLDFAPTLAHLVGLPVAPGWWGESIFATDRHAPYVAKLGDSLIVEFAGRRQTVSLERPEGDAAHGLMDLFWSNYGDAPAK